MISVTAPANAVSWFAMAFWTSEGMVGNPSVEPDQDCEVGFGQVNFRVARDPGAIRPEHLPGMPTTHREWQGYCHPPKRLSVYSDARST